MIKALMDKVDTMQKQMLKLVSREMEILKEIHIETLEMKNIVTEFEECF